MRHRRYVSDKQISRLPPMIPESEVFFRVLKAIEVIRMLPEPKWQKVRSNWPRSFEFHGEAIRRAMTPPGPEPTKQIKRAIKRLRYQDFADLHLSNEVVSNMPDIPAKAPPSSDEISDAEIAGEWFAKLALLPENVEEFERRVVEFRSGKRKVAQVTDQFIMTSLALGYSLWSIARHNEVKLDERQLERRINEISRSLFRIANRTAPIIDIEARQRARLACAVDPKARQTGT